MSNNVIHFVPRDKKIKVQVHCCMGCEKDYFHLGLDGRVICSTCLKVIKGFKVIRLEKDDAAQEG